VLSPRSRLWRELRRRLGSGIGFHGWIEEWDDAGPSHLSWGCVVLHLRDIGRFYDQVEPGTMVVIF
jgi:lipoprotein-anchoring transpeptidase ErfK/SrfK